MAGVEVCHWVEGADFGPPADVAVDAFGGGLPDEYASAMAARSGKSLWIVLEYLSAESWVAAHHGLPSPHPRLPLDRYFFFPGFGAGTGGLLRESGLTARRDDFLRHPLLPQALWRDAGFSPPDRNAKVISLFGYETPAVAEFLDAWASGPEAIVAAVPESRLSADVAAFFGASGPLGGRAMARGALEVRFLPFLAQDRYDELLWAADWNFVRGEDSFVRAQWAERPFVWHIYPQSERRPSGEAGGFSRPLLQGTPRRRLPSRCGRSGAGGTTRAGRSRGRSGRRGRISPARERSCASTRTAGRGRLRRQAIWR